MKQMTEKQNETLNTTASWLRQENREKENTPNNSAFISCLQELTKAVQILLCREEKLSAHHIPQPPPPKKADLFHPLSKIFPTVIIAHNNLFSKLHTAQQSNTNSRTVSNLNHFKGNSFLCVKKDSLTRLH